MIPIGTGALASTRSIVSNGAPRCVTSILYKPSQDLWNQANREVNHGFAAADHDLILVGLCLTAEISTPLLVVYPGSAFVVFVETLEDRRVLVAV